jgi:superfamily II DNA/RNA helicase
VFTSTKRAADDLASDLHSQGFAVGALHGDMKQAARTRTLAALRKGGLRVLVATDVAARGIDVQGISHVINYDLPRQAEDYVHRIGRTGRAGKNGIAISFANVRETFTVRNIERFTSQAIPVSVIEGLEPKQKAFDRKPAGAPKKFGAKPAGKFGGKFSDRGTTFGDRASAGKSFSNVSKPSGAKPDYAKSGAAKPSGLGNWNKPASAYAGKKEGSWGDKKQGAANTRRTTA